MLSVYQLSVYNFATRDRTLTRAVKYLNLFLMSFSPIWKYVL